MYVMFFTHVQYIQVQINDGDINGDSSGDDDDYIHDKHTHTSHPKYACVRPHI